MFRKLALTLAAVAALGSVALVSTEASARGGHGGGHGGGRGGGHGFHGGGHRGGFHGGGGFHRGGFHRGGFNRGFGGPRFFAGGPRFYGGYSGCYVRRLVMTPWGPRNRLVNRCY